MHFSEKKSRLNCVTHRETSVKYGIEIRGKKLSKFKRDKEIIPENCVNLKLHWRVDASTDWKVDFM